MKKISLEEEVARKKVRQILKEQKATLEIYSDLEVLAGIVEKRSLWEQEFNNSEFFQKGLSYKKLYRALSKIIDIEMQKKHTLYDTLKLAYALYALDKPIIIRKSTENKTNIWTSRQWIKEKNFWLLEADKSPKK